MPTDTGQLIKSEPKVNAKAVLKTTCEYVQEGTATVMLPDMLMLIFDNELWKEWTTSTGGEFASFNEAITANQPYGVGIGQYSGWINASQAWALCKGHSGVRSELLKLAADEAQPLAQHGGDRHQGRNTTMLGRGSDYLLGRLKRDRPDILERLANGELKSIRQAAIEAGILKPSTKKPTPEEQCIKAFRKAENKQALLEILIKEAAQ